ncbi:piggyBac transposable element-derived protein 4-like [Procambarus clarkii]|uniref:piggyBac transposable element-derived protein 4-like n=1 Tax=Procambarus clarkii TaxID=6728 RepID=UPI003742D852
MSDASSMSSHSTVTRGNGKRLSDEEIHDILYDDGALDDDLDYDPEKDLTQRSDTSEEETELKDVASVYGTRASPPWVNTVIISTIIITTIMCLHFENNSNEDRHDRLWKVRKMFSDMRGKFRDYFVPGQNVVIDKSLVLFKGRLAFKQYIPSKRDRFGLKFFVLCDCETGIVLDMIL